MHVYTERFLLVSKGVSVETTETHLDPPLRGQTLSERGAYTASDNARRRRGFGHTRLAHIEAFVSNLVLSVFKCS